MYHRNALNDIPSMYGPEHVAVLVRYNEMPGDDKIWVQVNETTGIYVSPSKFKSLRKELDEA